LNEKIVDVAHYEAMNQNNLWTTHLDPASLRVRAVREDG